MRKINPPAISFSEMYDECINNVLIPRKLLFQNAKQSIVDFTTDYDAQANAQNLHNFNTDNGQPPLDKNDLIFLYKNKLVDRTQPGRKYYDQIMLTSKNQICPYCDCSQVETLDHVLAKTHYSRFSISPNNLVPACRDCNSFKRDSVIATSSDIHFHPYFDAEPEHRWLFAEVIPDEENIIFKFFVKVIPSWTTDQNERAATHFRTFNLARKFSVMAASTILDDMGLVRLFESSPDTLKEHLKMVADDNLKKKLNSWKTAMFCALLIPTGFAMVVF